MIILSTPSAQHFIPFFALLLALFVSGCGINNIPTPRGEGQGEMVRRPRPVSAARRPDSRTWSRPSRASPRRSARCSTRWSNARAKATQIQVTPDIVTDPEKFKKFQEAQAQLSGALGRLLAMVERYPDLKSNQNFLALQSQLEGTENRIAVARRDYIEAVRVYNTELSTFPGLALGLDGLPQPQADGDFHGGGRRRSGRRP